MIGGTTSGNDYCQFIVSDIYLAGSLNINFVNGYIPQVRDHFILLSYSNIKTGDYSQVKIQTISGLYWFMEYKDNALQLWAFLRLFMPYLSNG